MASKRSKFNRKRRFASPLPSPDMLARLAEVVCYGGNPAHKRNPGDFGLVPPSQPRDHKSLCDEAGVLRRAEALRLLKCGVLRGMISDWDGTGFPRNIWSMTDDGLPLEAQLENAARGIYHGYPLETNDDFRVEVLARWSQSHG